MAGQTINDRLLAARHSIAGQGLAKSVCKATTEEMIGPKKKHLDYLIHCTNEPNVSIPQLANLLVERSQNTNWTVVFKALITVHHMLCYGNERFTQYLASSNSTFQLSNFLDKSGVQAGARVGYDMSPFIRRYAKYLNEKAMSYRSVAFDFCKVKRGKEDGTLRTMNAEKLLKTLPVLQAQLDGLLEFDCTSNDLTNGVISMAFMLLFRDLIRLFACYNDGIINLLEKYFEMNKKQCRDALDLYKKFLIRMDRVGEFLKVAENVGIDKGDIPDLTKAPSSLLDALEQHLASLEGKKGSAANTPTQTASTAFGTVASNARLDQTGNGHIDEALRQQALAEEEAVMNQYKAKVQSPVGGLSTNPFLSSPTGNQGIVDLFSSATAAELQSQKASDDLLQLAGNPFVDMFRGQESGALGQAPPTSNNMWMSNGNDNNFSSVFGNQDPQSTAAQGSAGSEPNPFMADFSAPTSQSGVGVGNAVAMGLFGNDGENKGGDLFSASGQADLFGGEPVLSGQVDVSDVNFTSGITPIVGTIADIGKLTATPPPGPPPPATGPNGTPRAVSPAVGGASPGRPNTNANKSAFDDLNDSIRMALGGSPSRPSPAVQQPSQQPQQQQPASQIIQQQSQQGFVAFDAGANNMAMPAGAGQTIINTVPGYIVPPTQVPIGYGSPVKQPIAGFDGAGSVLISSSTTVSGANNVSAAGQPAAAAPGSKVLTGDLDSSLASLAQNLSINKSAQQQVKGMQWNSPKNTAKTGGPAGWTPQPMAATTGAGYRPMGQGMTQLPASTTFGFSPQSTPLGMQGMPMGMQGMRPMMGAIPGAPAPGGGMMMPGANPMMGGAVPQQPQPAAPPQGNAVQLDPFGAL